MVVLRDLDVDGAVITHSAPQPIGRNMSVGAPTSSPSRFPSFVSAPTSPQHQHATVNLANNSAGWQTSDRRAHGSGAVKSIPSEGLSAYIPAYQMQNANARPPLFGQSNVNANDSRSPFSKKALRDRDNDAEACRQRAEEYRALRDTALRQASTHWQRGKLGREVASFYAEEARKLDAGRREWNVQAARAQVSGSMHKGPSGGCSIDLHGLTVKESIIATKEILDHSWSSNGSAGTSTWSFTIITGIGRHSSGSLGVLGPAVQKALEEDGWYVRKEHGKLVVTGARRG